MEGVLLRFQKISDPFQGIGSADDAAGGAEPPDYRGNKQGQQEQEEKPKEFHRNAFRWQGWKWVETWHTSALSARQPYRVRKE